MARAALLGRLTWRRATIRDVTPETATAVTLDLAVDDWPGHRAGQHVDVRLTAPDGYSAVRPYSLASAGGSGRVQVTVELTPRGEVSTYLVRGARAGHHVEVRGPLGNWFVWDGGDPAPVQLIGAGSGVVPLVSMLRTHAAGGHEVPMRLLYSVAAPERVLYRDEVRRLVEDGCATLVHTRTAPPQDARAPARLTMAELAASTVPASLGPRCFVCGPTGFVETVIEWLVSLGHPQELIRAERYGERSEVP